jgi:amidase
MPPRTSATVVNRLRAAGAVILGKTNLSEWANFRSTQSTSGWSAVGGQTSNPYVLDRNPSGSSSGSAVAVAAALAQAAVGTETDGSIVCPSGQASIVGHKPTLDLVSRSGTVPISAQQDTAGPMARNVVDAALLLAVLQGRDPVDAVTMRIPVEQPKDYAGLLRDDALRGTRLGIWRIAGQDSAVDEVMTAVVTTLEAAGARAIDVDLPFQEEIAANELPALFVEFRHDLEQYLRTRPDCPRRLSDLVAFNSDDAIELSKFGQELFEQAQAAPSLGDPDYLTQRHAATPFAKRSIDGVLAAHGLDAIVAPTNSPAWKTNYAVGDVLGLDSSTPAAVAGYPSVTVPAGFSGPVPMGVSFMAGLWSDAQVLIYTAAFEQASQARCPPGYLTALPTA